MAKPRSRSNKASQWRDEMIPAESEETQAISFISALRLGLLRAFYVRMRGAPR